MENIIDFSDIRKNVLWF